MATKVNVNGKYQTRPGVYSTIKSGVKNTVANTAYGNILIIDDGIGAGFGGGSGINGQFKNGSDAVYSFDSLQDFRNFVKGGEVWNLAKPLFNPSGSNQGVSRIYYIRACTTVAAAMALTLTNGAFTISVKDEGVTGNGVLAIGNLSNGYAAKLIRVNTPANAATFTSTTTQASDSSHPQISKLVATNIHIGDVFTATINSHAIVVTATSTLAIDLYTAMAAAINADSTVSSAVTATANASQVTVTADANNTSFTESASVTATPAQFKFQIWHGNYKGLDATNNLPYDGVTATTVTPSLIIESPVVTLLSDLITWFQTSPDFNIGFSLNAGSTATGNIVVGDLSSYPGYVLAAGGSESYASSDLDNAIAVINNLDFVHILAMQYGSNAAASNNQKLFDFVKNNSKYDRLFVVGGGYDKSTFDNGSSSSTGISAYYNNDKVIVVHGGVKKTNRSNISGFNTYSQLYKAATILGRCVGLPSQVPVTLKSIDIDGEVHLLSDDEQERAIAAGVMYSYYDYELGGVYVAGLDVNTLQKNDYLINDDGTTFNWQLKRIEAELNKGVVINAKQRFFNPEGQGGNRNTTSPVEVVKWAEGYFLSRTASSQKDDLIIKAYDINASIDQDNLSLNYKFVGNTEISKIISTGVIVEA